VLELNIGTPYASQAARGAGSTVAASIHRVMRYTHALLSFLN
jgi:hypothetical protein